MAVTTPNHLDEQARDHRYDRANDSYRHASASAVSWGAIIAGAAAAASLSLILLILGTGLGLSSVSPWYQQGVDAETFGTSTIVWLVMTQLLSSAMGGYLAGRLRSKWVEVHTDEVYFRDTAHGFLAWALSSLVTAGLLTSVIASILGGGLHAGAGMASGAMRAGTAIASHAMHGGAHVGARQGGPMAYFIDSLFRREPSADGQAQADATSGTDGAGRGGAVNLGEVSRIFQQAAAGQALPDADVRYLGQMVAQRTGLTQQQAETRVSDTFARLTSTLEDAQVAARQVADEARRASAHGALWLFLSLLAGAFVASLSATLGGRRRDA